MDFSLKAKTVADMNGNEVVEDSLMQISDSFTVKVTTADDAKKFKMRELTYDELLDFVRGRQWSSPLPLVIKFYYIDYSDGGLMCVDTHEDLREAIRYYACELSSNSMQLFLASSHKEAM